MSSRIVRLGSLVLVACAMALGTVPHEPALATPSVSMRFLARWRTTRPVSIENADDGTDRLFIVEKNGRIKLVSGGTLAATPFLDISSRVGRVGYEQGLLGLAFPPDFATKQYFYVDYTDLAGDTVVARYQVSAGDPNVADPASEQILLTIDQPFANHNGGHLAFGPDGYLYIGAGDGGSAGDPYGNGQNTNTLLGKLLRIDTEGGASPYGVPASNPFVGHAGYRPEIWALGLRNPWKFSFDRATGDLWIGDVGQNTREEIDFEPAGFAGGRNYGWNRYEGSLPYPIGSAPTPTVGLAFPVHQYDHTTGGDSITGGHVYRGSAQPGLAGLYLFGDFEWGKFWVLDPADYSVQTVLDTTLWPSTFGEDEAGELYMADYSSGTVFEVRDGATPPATTLKRLSGSDRYATAKAVALDAFPSGCTTAVVATGEQFPDALAASGLAGALDAPVLLTKSNGAPQALLEALGPVVGLGVRDVVIVGGMRAVSSAVVSALTSRGYAVTRISGADRYATAAAVARRVADLEGAAFAGSVFVVRGDAFPDALAAAPLAYAGRGPILLTRSSAVPAATAGAIADIGASEAVIVGGTVAIGAEVPPALGVPSVRIDGIDRYATAAAVSQYAFDQAWTDYGYVGIAKGTDYPDGLTGGAGAGSRGGVLLLTKPDVLRAAAASALIEHQPDVSAAAVYGGSAAVDSPTYSMIRWHLP